MINVASLLVSYLKTLGVEYIFGVPGGAIEPLYNALAISARNGGPKPIVARHETGAAFMAEGYARETGKLGVCCATSGPGATNLITGVANAYDNSIPMLVLTGQPAISLWGKGALQESTCTGVDVMGMFEHCTRYNTAITHVEQAERKIQAAILRALISPKGPSHLAIPVDVQRQMIDAPLDQNSFMRLLTGKIYPSADQLKDFIANISEASDVIFIIGRECSKRTVFEIMELANKLPHGRFMAVPDALRYVDQSNPKFSGVYGFAGHRHAIKIVKELDHTAMIVAVGVRFGEWTSAVWNSTLLSHRLIHVDLNVDNFLRTPAAKQHLQVCPEELFVSLNAFKWPEIYCKPKEISFTDEPEKISDESTPIKPQRLMSELSKRFVGAHFITDPGNSTAWAIHYLNRDLDVLMDFAPMGWSIGTSVGMAFADEKPVVCITGDGSYLMSGQEITVAQEHKLPVIYVILNDAALGMVKHGQRLSGSERTSFELPSVDYVMMGNAMGVSGYIINSPEDFNHLPIQEIMNRKGPTILDVRIDPEEVPPMNLRIMALNK